MRINTPFKIAVFLSIVIFAFALVIFYIVDDDLNIIFSFIIFFLATIVLIYYIVKRFFHERIKVIYKNIYKFQSASNALELDINKVEKQAEDWADAKEEELNTYKRDENFRR